MLPSIGNLTLKLVALEVALPPAGVTHHSLSLAFNGQEAGSLIMLLTLSFAEPVSLYLDNDDLDVPAVEFVRRVKRVLDGECATPLLMMPKKEVEKTRAGGKKKEKA